MNAKTKRTKKPKPLPKCPVCRRKPEVVPWNDGEGNYRMTIGCSPIVLHEITGSTSHHLQVVGHDEFCAVKLWRKLATRKP